MQGEMDPKDLLRWATWQQSWMRAKATNAAVATGCLQMRETDEGMLTVCPAARLLAELIRDDRSREVFLLDIEFLLVLTGSEAEAREYLWEAVGTGKGSREAARLALDERRYPRVRFRAK